MLHRHIPDMRTTAPSPFHLYLIVCCTVAERVDRSAHLPLGVISSAMGECIIDYSSAVVNNCRKKLCGKEGMVIHSKIAWPGKHFDPAVISAVGTETMNLGAIPGSTRYPKGVGLLLANTGVQGW